MSEIQISVDAEDFRESAIMQGLDSDTFTQAATKAVRITIRQLRALGLSRLAKAIGASAGAFKKRSRVVARDRGMDGSIWLGLEPISASTLTKPPSFSFAGPNGSRWARASRIAAPFVGMNRKFKVSRGRNRGRTDIILKLFRTIQTEGLEIADRLGDQAEELFSKNMHREIDQAVRRARFAA